MTRIARWAGLLFAVLALGPANAERNDLGIDPEPGGLRTAPPNECRVIDLELQPADLPGTAFPARPQIAAWIEEVVSPGVEAYYDTIFVTNMTGRFGIGNRAGVFGMRSGPRWPYGARPDALPVWAHRHGLTWPVLHFQNGDGFPGTPLDPDHNLSHPLEHSSIEATFTRPLDEDEPQWDAGSTATPVNTDKGQYHPSALSHYPPRSDIGYTAGRDHVDVGTFRAVNPFDAVSQASPAVDVPFRYTWLIPPGFYEGTPKDYVMYVEVSRELDHNATYNETTQPPIAAAGWNEYGVAYRGQPSIVWRVPFTIGPDPSRAITTEYFGYGTSDGSDGTIHPRDATITDDEAMPGSGARRLAHVFDPVTGDTYQVRVQARFEVDEVAPAAAGSMAVVGVDSATADVAFVAPGDDDMIGRVAGYDIRVRTGDAVTIANFTASTRIFDTSPPVAAGETQTLHLAGLVPLTDYHVGIRAYDACKNYGPLQVVELRTTDRIPGTVDWCFVATAAYGSAMAEDVTLLRTFRDRLLRSNVIGELAVEAYYTFGPAFAGVIAESELLRATAREALRPVVERARALLAGD
jgi:hypothetical protein